MQTNHNIESIFAQAVELAEPLRRGDFLDEACRGDAGLRNRIGALLDANQRAERFMQEPAAILKLADDASDAQLTEIGEQPGQQIGPYLLLEQIGEGGMGSVFLAEQQQPVRRQVALKIVKPGLDTKEVIARFDAERESLARIDHPHVARVLDAGATDSGRPYFVMELVKGESISDYCQREQLTIRERLQLFIPVCAAIQHAHQKGIIHRDIKPQNVMVATVDGKPIPKVIDFGIAKATDQQLTQRTLFTRFGQFIGTPAYMSPEQAEQSDIDVDTRSDVYSLGALLYELLTGVAPFDEERFKTMGHDEMRRVIREENPPRPSDAISSLAMTSDTDTVARAISLTKRGTKNQADGNSASSIVFWPQRRATSPPVHASELKRAIAGELDWVVMRAMEKAPERRYPTATALAEDIQRFLSDEPVVAKPQSWRYRCSKFISRNRTWVATLAAIAGILIVATFASSRWAVQAHNAMINEGIARREAEEQAGLANDLRVIADEKSALATAKAESLAEVLTFMNQGLFAQADPLAEPNREVKLRSILDRAARQLDGRTQLRPAVEVAVRTTIGETYRGLGLYNEAIPHLQRAFALQKQQQIQQLPGGSDIKTVESANRLARTLLSAAQFDEAKSVIEAASQATKSLGEYHEQALETTNLQAWLADELGDEQRAEQLLLGVLQQRRTELGDEHPETCKAMSNLARVYRSQGRLDDAEELLEQAYDNMMLRGGEWHPDTLKVSTSYASLLLAQGEREQARELYESLVMRADRLLGVQHHRTLVIKNGLALLYLQEQRYALAQRLLEDALDMEKRVLGPEHPTTLVSMHNLGLVLSAQGNPLAAEQLYLDELAGRRETFGLRHSSTLSATTGLAYFYLDQARYADAVPYYEQAVSMLERDDADSLDAYSARTMLAICRHKDADHLQAKADLETLLARCQQTRPDHWLRFVVQSQLGEVLLALDDRPAAIDALERGYEGLKIHAAEVPERWSPLGVRAATRRLISFYESADEEDLRARAAVFQDELEQLRREQNSRVNATRSQQQLPSGKMKDGNSN